MSVISETWLHPSIPDAAVQLGGRTVHRWDRNKDSGKSRGGGLCIFIHNSWSINTTTIDTHCSPDLEYITVKCHYIPPEANVGIALALLLKAINTQQRAHPDGVHIIVILIRQT